MYRRWPLAALAAALALITAPAAFGASTDPPATAAGWHGREIRDPLPQRVREAVARFPRGWSAGSVGRGTGYRSPDGSRRVREVQRRLVHRGYRPGPVDGRYGSRTRAAVLWFQTKHGLPRTGRVDARSVATLRQPPQARHTPTTASPPSAADEARALARSSAQTQPEPADQTWLVLLAVIVAAGLAGIAWWMRTELRERRSQLADVRHEEHRAQLTAVTPPSAHVPVDVLGYITVARGRDRDREIDTAAQIIASWCEGRRWRLSQVVHDVEGPGARITDRPGLAYALDQIAAGQVAGLVLAHLGDLTRSVTELAQLLRWMNTAGAFIIALDYELDTSTAAGDLAAGALMEIGEWERGRIAGRTQPGLRAMRTQTASRASVRDDPELSDRIRAMRARGLSLQAISDTLNAEGVPTLRGGTHWRPSSVQAATGYKRPPAKSAAGLRFPTPARTNDTNARERWDEEPS